MRIDAENAYAVAIDFQERLLPAMEGKEQLLEASCKLLKGLTVLGVPICATQQYTKGLGNTVEEVCRAGGLTSYIEKIRFSAYEDIKDVISEKKFIILCGIEAHICVLQTVIGLQEAGFVPVLVTDCVSSRKSEDKHMAFRRAQQEGAILTTCEALLFELLGSAGTEISKQIQRLVK